MSAAERRSRDDWIDRDRSDGGDPGSFVAGGERIATQEEIEDRCARPGDPGLRCDDHRQLGVLHGDPRSGEAAERVADQHHVAQVIGEHGADGVRVPLQGRRGVLTRQVHDGHRVAGPLQWLDERLQLVAGLSTPRERCQRRHLDLLRGGRPPTSSRPRPSLEIFAWAVSADVNSFGPKTSIRSNAASAVACLPASASFVHSAGRPSGLARWPRRPSDCVME